MNKISSLTLLGIFIFSCSEENSDRPFETEFQEDISLNSLSDTIWKSVESSTSFSIDVPNRMKKMTELNNEADMEIGYVEKIDEIVYENYLVILMESKSSIDSLGLDFEFDAMSYYDISIEAFGEDLIDFIVLNKDSKIEKINGLDCVISRAQGTMLIREEVEHGVISQKKADVYYMLGVFEGENAFYQVLTWCIAKQQSVFKKDMIKIIRSFKERT